AALEGIERLKSWFREAGSPVSLRDLDIPESAIPALADNSMALAAVWRLKEYDSPVVSSILSNCR
ncbi:MAG: NADH-dependent alcohol dehydrogenase, partial [Desulfurivibrionaceae bacterium]